MSYETTPVSLSLTTSSLSGSPIQNGCLWLSHKTPPTPTPAANADTHTHTPVTLGRLPERNLLRMRIDLSEASKVMMVGWRDRGRRERREGSDTSPEEDPDFLKALAGRAREEWNLASASGQKQWDGRRERAVRLGTTGSGHQSFLSPQRKWKLYVN